jgi:lysophospholipase L1-like esterase
MKSILCYGDSITWGYNPHDGSRYSFGERWPGILQQELSGRARIVEEGLNGRTVATDDPAHPNRNGLAMLPPLLESHAPLDIVIIMLGTNDSAPYYRLTSGQIAINCTRLITAVRSGLAGPDGGAPKIVLIAPPPFGSLNPYLALFYTGGEATSRGLAEGYRVIADWFDCTFLDAGQVATASSVDGIHLEPAEQRKLGLAVKDIVDPML